MAYQSNIPLPTDRLRVSQGDLNGNFQTTSGGLGTMLNPNQGYIKYPNQVATPTLTPTQPGIFAKMPGNPPYPVATGVSELFLNKNSFKNVVTTNEIPFTASNLSVETPTNASTLNWSYLPTGIIIQFGFYQNKSNTNTIPFKFAFPNDRLSLFLSEFFGGGTNTTDYVAFDTFTTTAFNIRFTGGGTKSGYYIALGY